MSDPLTLALFAFTDFLGCFLVLFIDSFFEVVCVLVVVIETLIVIVLLFELLPFLFFPLDEVFQMSLEDKVLNFLLEVDALFSIMAMILVIIAVLDFYLS